MIISTASRSFDGLPLDPEDLSDYDDADLGNRPTDAEQVRVLRDADFAGPMFEAFVRNLWLYAWPVMLDQLRTGKIVGIATGIPHGGMSSSERRLFQDSATLREELAIEAIGDAVPRFITIVQEGKWKAEKGASLYTYFVGTCAACFWDRFSAWQRARARQLKLTHKLVQVPVEHPADQFENVVEREAVKKIYAVANAEQRAILRGLYVGLTHAEIGVQLGISAPAVEGRLYRLRLKARALVKAGQIDRSIIPLSRAEARGAQVRAA